MDSQNDFSFFNLAVVNSWLEYRHDADVRGVSSNEQLDLLDFTLRIIDALAKKNKKCKIMKRGRPSLSPLEPRKQVRYTENRPIEDVRFDQIGHWPIHTDAKAQRCKMEGCTGKVRVFCEKCKVHLCLTKSRNRFEDFHTKK